MVSGDTETPLMHAVEKEDYYITKYLLENGADPKVWLFDEGFNHLEEYSDPFTERGKNLRDAICKKLNFASLDFQSLEGVIKAIGIEPCKLCTYGWNGKE